MTTVKFIYTDTIPEGEFEDCDEAASGRGVYAVADPDGEYIYLSDGERNELPPFVGEILNAHPGKAEWPGGATWPRA